MIHMVKGHLPYGTADATASTWWGRALPPALEVGWAVVPALSSVAGPAGGSETTSSDSSI
jgi:hypothetical protein